MGTAYRRFWGVGGVVLILALAVAGCSSRHELRASAARYFVNRGLDAADILELGVEHGQGARVALRYGLGVWGWGDTHTSVWRLGQRAAHVKSETGVLAPLPFPLGVPFWALAYCMTADWEPEARLATVVFLGYGDEGEWDSAGRSLGDVAYAGPIALKEDVAWGRSFSVGLDAVVRAGLRVRVYPVEVLDFVGGIIGLDLAGDDVAPRVSPSPDLLQPVSWPRATLPGPQRSNSVELPAPSEVW